MLKLNEIIKSKKVIIPVIGVVIVIIFFAVINGNRVSIDKIYESYRENAAVCMEKYDGKEVSMRVKVSSIDASLTSITVDSPNNDLQFMFCSLNTDKLKEKAKKLKAGEIIIVKGTLHIENMMGIYISMDTESIS